VTVPKEKSLNWQKQLKEQPPVWMVYLDIRSYDHSETMYDSKEGAEVEVVWRKNHGYPHAEAVCVGNLYNFELAKQRWAWR
jgi:hypothetical protein